MEVAAYSDELCAVNRAVTLTTRSSEVPVLIVHEGEDVPSLRGVAVARSIGTKQGSRPERPSSYWNLVAARVEER
jgi:hypothetical protein